MVDHMKSTVGSDPARFVTGISAGGMTTVMMATYPDVFRRRRGDVGCPYPCAASYRQNTCQMGNVSHTPRRAIWSATRSAARPYPRLISFHGSSDFTVAPANQQQEVDQWSNLLGIDETPEVNETFRTATHKVYRDASGRSMIETYLVSGMGHALTVDVGSNTDQGGQTGAFSEDHDIYSSFCRAVLRADHGRRGRRHPSPTARSPPAAGATVSGSVAVTRARATTSG
jgi:poly(3-hydroxybutyrate) depolymerase